jgi:hypothetical protein
MSLEVALWGYLTTTPRQTQAAIGDRLYPLVIPQEVQTPAAAYQTISTPERGLDHNGPSGWLRARVQFSCQARKPMQARAIAQAIANDLHGLRATVGNVQVHYASVTGDNDTSELLDAAVRRVDVELLYRPV